MFIYKSGVDTVLLHVLEKIPDSIEQCVSYNYMHGQLEFLAELIRLNYVLYNTGSSSALIKVHQCIYRCKWLISEDTPLMVRKVYLSIVCMLNSVELNSSLLYELSEQTKLDVHSINLYFSIIQFYLSSSNTVTQSLLIKFSAKLFNTISIVKDSRSLCTELLEHPQILPWLLENSNNTYASLFKRYVHMPDGSSHTDICSHLEILVQMLGHVITLNSNCFDVDFNQLTNYILRYSTMYTSLKLELCCLQISSIILIRKINYPHLLIEREIELFALLTRLLNTHSKPDSSEDSRLIAVNYLIKIFSSLTLYPSLFRPISTIQFVIIKNMIILLQDEVVDVRTSLATCISQVLDSHLPLDNHITLKLVFTWLANTLFILEECWELMLDYISSKICINVNAVKDEVVLFEKGKDNIYGEDCVNCELAFKTLRLVSINLKQTELFGNFVRYLFEYINTKSNILSSNLATTHPLDGMLSSNSLLYRQITGLLCVIKLMESLGENLPDNLNTILNTNEESCLISLYLKQIEKWTQFST
ncbi:hypothetical protein LOD99_11806 [Oopsacas minuta]|uniref:Uncharacterized protein n=1 Tax=Oopsacas minuta TaxID=111878 RepID=A0AAV7JKK9_9METZ|nr:hypothetical protein LOD99_11806 [Oopsacas minuta]